MNTTIHSHSHIEYIHLKVSDLEWSIQFFRYVLRFELSHLERVTRWLDLDSLPKEIE